MVVSDQLRITGYYGMCAILDSGLNHIKIEDHGQQPTCQAVCMYVYTWSVLLLRNLPGLECGTGDPLVR